MSSVWWCGLVPTYMVNGALVELPQCPDAWVGDELVVQCHLPEGHGMPHHCKHEDKVLASNEHVTKVTVVEWWDA